MNVGNFNAGENFGAGKSDWPPKLTTQAPHCNPYERTVQDEQKLDFAKFEPKKPNFEQFDRKLR